MIVKKNNTREIIANRCLLLGEQIAIKGKAKGITKFIRSIDDHTQKQQVIIWFSLYFPIVINLDNFEATIKKSNSSKLDLARLNNFWAIDSKDHPDYKIKKIILTPQSKSEALKFPSDNELKKTVLISHFKNFLSAPISSNKEKLIDAIESFHSRSTARNNGLFISGGLPSLGKRSK